MPQRSPESRQDPVVDPRFASLVVQCPVPGKEGLTGSVEEVLDPNNAAINALDPEKAQGIRDSVQELVNNAAELVDVDGLNIDRAIKNAFGRAVVRDSDNNFIRKDRSEASAESQEASSQSEPKDFFKT